MLNSKFKDCIEICQACANTCENCAVACLEEDNVTEMTRCIRLNLDCSTLCQMAVTGMNRSSEFVKAICQLCADICEACAAECHKHEHEHCQQCARVCMACATECRKMAV